MKIVFFPVACRPFHAKTLEERPLGGTETAIIRLAEALAGLGQDVTVLSDLAAHPPTRPAYLSVHRAGELGEFDVLIVIRGLKGLTCHFQCKKRFFWSGDAYKNVHTYGIGDRRMIACMDAFLAVSDWQAETICRKSGFPIEKTYVLRNGIRLSDFQGEEKRFRKRLIYSSNPSRGLIHLPEIYLDLKRRHSDAELSVFGSAAVYEPTWPPVNLFEQGEQLFALLRSLPGCRVSTSLLQHLLAREFMKSAIWAYPTEFEETSCITAMEAQAAGCVPVTSALAALKETVGDGGILIDAEAGTKRYFDLFIEACERLLTDVAFFEQISLRGRQRAQDPVHGFDWKLRAQGFLDYLKERFQLS
ncbi:MAG: glycosyltransferase family 4 protein [Parachlamydia sp.]|nr:glycosyltransferase family 4 protein [Parachlamydia sp.]